jgi:hypothetical protein
MVLTQTAPTQEQSLIVEIAQAVRDGMPYDMGERLKGYVQAGKIELASDLLAAWQEAE